MEQNLAASLANLRLVVGYLGEKDQFAWWRSSFFARGSDAFLSPLFPRTQVLAECQSVTAAAAIVHDEHIGIGNVFHLFRLPEDMEHAIHDALLAMKRDEVLKDRERALSYLLDASYPPERTDPGPVRMGDRSALHDLRCWRLVAGLYVRAFEEGVPVYPYFAGAG